MTLSVVSHGQSDLVCALVAALSVPGAASIVKLVVTSNVPALDDFSGLIDSALSYPFELKLIENAKPIGFGANQNQAFRHCSTEHFCIINPDIELVRDPFIALAQLLTQPGVGIAYPRQVDASFKLLDFERKLVTPASLWCRYIGLQRYQPQAGASVDWVSGAFMAFKSSVFQSLGGFDERYFLYCEDVDICLRAQLAGYQLAKADIDVIHHTRRSTLKSRQHLMWHLRSLLRLWGSEPYRQFKKSQGR